MARHLTIAGVVFAVWAGLIAAPHGMTALSQAEQTTVVGCLRAGADAGEFVLVDDEQMAYQVRPAEDLDLSAHLNHRVELTGTTEKTGDTTVLTATALKMVATSCDP